MAWFCNHSHYTHHRYSVYGLVLQPLAYTHHRYSVYGLVLQLLSYTPHRYSVYGSVLQLLSYTPHRYSVYMQAFESTSNLTKRWNCFFLSKAYSEREGLTPALDKQVMNPVVEIQPSCICSPNTFLFESASGAVRCGCDFICMKKSQKTIQAHLLQPACSY